MLKLAPDVEKAQTTADRLLDAVIDVVTAACPDDGRDHRSEARADVAVLLEQVRDAEREACLDVMRKFDRTGREWVRESLWSNIFRDAIARIEARGLVANYRAGPGKAVAAAWADQEGPLPPEAAGEQVTLTATIGYPGSRISDLLIGGHKVQVPNEALRDAMAGRRIEGEQIDQVPALEMHGPIDRYLARRRADGRGPDNA